MGIRNSNSKAVSSLILQIGNNHKIPPDPRGKLSRIYPYENHLAGESFVLNVQRQDFSVTVQPPVLCPVVGPVRSVSSVRRSSKKKDISPSSKTKREINTVKGVSIVDHCAFPQNVHSAHNVAHAQLLGGRLQNFCQTWSLLGANPRVVSILKDRYILPFKLRPPLLRDPLIISGYANPLRNLYLKEALHVLIRKKAVERVRFEPL